MTQKTKLQLKIGILVFTVLSTVLGSLFVLNEPSSAVENSVAQKAVLYGLAQCYKDGAIASSIASSSYDGTYTLMTYGGNNHALPTGKYNIEYASCSELLNGKFDTDFPGALAMAGINAPQNSADTSALSSFLTGLGYTETKGTSGRCASYTYKYESNDSTAVYKMCVDTEKIDGKDIITGDIMEVGGDTTAMSMKVSSGVVELYCDQLGRGGCSDHGFTKGVTNFDEFAGEILADLKEHNSSAVCLLWWCPWKLVESVGLEDKSDVLATYEIDNTTSAINKMIKYLSNGNYSSISNLSLSSNERITLLQDYLLNYYKVKVYGDRCNLDESQQSIARSAGYDEITTTMFGSGLQTCWITPTANKNNAVIAYSRGGYVDGSMMSYTDIITTLGGTVNTILDSDKARCNRAATSQYDEAQAILSRSTDEAEIQRANTTISELNAIKNTHGEYWYNDESGAIVCYAFTGVDGNIVNTTTTSPSIPDPDLPSDDDGGSAPNCFTDGSSLGWILCPVLEIMSNAVNGMYDTVANKWLEVGANEMAADNSNGVYVGWKTFRDIANVIFVIMLVVVIFSQVTGFGLSNYGVKKALPTLIMVAVLVNLSFILCQLAVDATNILGDGLRRTFESLKVGTGTGVGLSDIVTGISTGLLQLAVVGGAVGLGVYFSGASIGMLLVPLLLALISALIGTLIFFLSLAIRKAGIFAMVVLCPAAIVCYALPNTKRFFDRWLKLFTALLMVYPICGILMGGGKFFSSILLTSGENDFFMALTAMLIQVVPFFFIPTLIKSSLNMIGNIGAKLSNLGSRFTRGAQGMLGRSHWAQERQQRLARDANIRRDTRLANKWKKRLENLDSKRDSNGELSKFNQRRYRRAEYEGARASARYRRSADEDARAAVEAHRALPTQGSMQYMNMMDTYENAAMEREINEWQASMINGHMKYTNGTGANAQEIDVDVNNLGKINAEGNLENTPNAERSLSAALLHHLNAYDSAEDKNSEAAKLNLLKAQAIASRLLDAGGDNGQTIVTNALRGRTFGTNGMAKDRNDIQSVSRLSEYIARNGKWMGQIKKTDVGSFSFLNDTANKTADIKDRAFYHTTGDKKITAANIPGLSDGFFEGIVHEINQDTYKDANSEAAKRLLEIDAAATRAMADERIANEIKPETRDWLNRIHQKAYEIQQQRWFNGNTNGVANASQFKGYDSTGAEVQATGMDDDGYLVRQLANGTKERLRSSASGPLIKADDVYQRSIRRYRDLVAGQSQEELKILRKRDMPANIEIDPSTNTYRMKQGNGSFIDLTPDQQRVVDKIIDYNASVDIQNQENQRNQP